MSNGAQLTLNGEKSQKIIEYPNGRKVKRQLKDYEKDLGQRGIYNKKNPLNDLSGKEWTHFINSVNMTDFAKNEEDFKLWKYLQESVIATKYSTNGDDSIAHNLRKLHPSPKPPQIMRDLIAFFTKAGGWVLDPFMGVGGTLLGASLLEEKRNAVGIDLSKEYVDIYNKAAKQEGLSKQIALVGDSRNIEKFDEVNKRKFDLILTDPPYADMMSKLRTGGSRNNKGVGVSTPFTEDEKDLGNISYEEFFPEFRKIIEKSLKFLKFRGYLAIFCKDIQPTKKHHNLLHADIVSELCKIRGLQFKGYKIWYDKTINLYPYGYPFSFVANQLHQYILIFRKES